MNNTNLNIKKVLTWGSFVVIIGLIVWGLIAASNKEKRELAGIAPVDAVAETDWVKGNASSTVTIVEYSDFQCPACAAYFPLLEELYAKDSNKFRFVYRHFPLTQHANAIEASQAAEAAGRQGKFWEMYAVLFEKQKEWEKAKDVKAVFSGYAKDIGLDLDKYDSDFDLPEIMEKINADIKSGTKAGVNSTPTFYLNGKKINAQTYEQFKKLLDEAIANTTNS